MRYIIILFVLLSLFLVPFYVQAVWWNPFSWGIWDKGKANVSETLPEKKEGLEGQKEPEPVESVKEETPQKEIIRETITEYRDNPQNLSAIESFRNRVAELEVELTLVKSANEDLGNQFIEQQKKHNLEVKGLKWDIEDLDRKWQKKYDGLYAEAKNLLEQNRLSINSFWNEYTGLYGTYLRLNGGIDTRGHFCKKTDFSSQLFDITFGVVECD